MNTPPFTSRRLVRFVVPIALALAVLALLPTLARAPEAALPTIATPTATATRAAPSPPPPSPTRAPTPTPQPRIEVGATADPQTITFRVDGQIPNGAAEALLWYDTAAGNAIRRIPLSGGPAISASVTITPTQEGLTMTERLPSLDYWWAVRDRREAIVRSSASLRLPPPIESLAQTPPITAPTQIAWVERATPHFRLLAPPASAAARDLDRLRAVAEASYTQASHVITPTKPVSITVYLVPRVFWQGGVAYGRGGTVAISYLDRNYAGVAAWTYFVHEVTHALSTYVLPRAAEAGGVLGEGVAVYTTGGHYGLEQLDAWAAVLAASDSYVPLCRLRYDFYAAQHEIAYQEGASFAAYLIRSYGLEAFRQIYAGQKPQRGNHDTTVEAFCADDDRRIVAPTGKSAGGLERDWLAYLKTLQPTDEQRRAWQLTVRFFDTMRRYQEALDPAARDLPPAPDTWDRATAAKFLNAATGDRAAALETMLGAALPALQRGDPDHAAALLDAIESSLASAGAPGSPLARDYAAIVELLDAQARALRLGDRTALGRTLAAPDLAAALPFTSDDLLHDLRYTPAQLDVHGDVAEGIVQVDGVSLDGRQRERALYRVRFSRTGGGWLVAAWSPYSAAIEPPPGPGAIGGIR